MNTRRNDKAKAKRDRRARFSVEGLEDRNLMATWGMPWVDPQHLTLSFTPDGTSVAGGQSQLFQTFDTELGAGNWEKTLLKGVQTWAANANINVSVVGDGGEAIGSPGPAQGDPRFGDIRVAAAPLATGVLATSSPYDPSMGTFSGDLILNTSYDWNPADAGSYDLLTVALHESGHLFGFADSSDPTAFMYNVYTGPKTGIAPAAVTALQALYGPSTMTEAIKGDNNTLGTATPLPPLAPGATTMTLSDGLATPSAVDFYSFQAPNTLSGGGANISVQTAGISLLTPTLTVLDASGNVLATSSASGPLDGGTSVHLASVIPGARYFVKVSGATGDVLGAGAYNLVVNPNVAVTTTTAATNLGKATPIVTPAGYDGATPLTAGGSILNQVGSQVYSFKTLAANPNGVSVQLQQQGIGLAAPQLLVYDSSQTLVASSVATDPTNQSLTLYLNTVNPNATYFVKVVNGLTSGLSIGSYQLQVAFNSTLQGSTAINLASPSLPGGGIVQGPSATNTTPTQALALQTPAGYAPRSRYVTLGALSVASPQSYYKIAPPANLTNQPLFMTVTVESLQFGGLNSWVSIFDDQGNAVKPLCLSNEGGIEVFQVAVSPTVKNYSVGVSAAQAGGPQSTGGFFLGVQFGQAGASLNTLAGGTFAAPTAAAPTPTPQVVSFVSDQSRYYRFLLGTAATNSSLQATILDQNGNSIASMTTIANQSSSITLFLQPGTYSIRLTPINQAGGSTSPLSWTITDEALSDPILPYTYTGSGSSSTTIPK